MGAFQVQVQLGDQQGQRLEPLDVVVDTGATYTLVPAPVMNRLGLTPAHRMAFILANGEQIERDLVETRIRIDGAERTTVVVFGDEDSPALLGVVTLETFGLGVDPVNRRLIPVPGLLLSLHPSPPPTPNPRIRGLPPPTLGASPMQSTGQCFHYKHALLRRR